MTKFPNLLRFLLTNVKKLSGFYVYFSLGKTLMLGIVKYRKFNKHKKCYVKGCTIWPLHSVSWLTTLITRQYYHATYDSFQQFLLHGAYQPNNETTNKHYIPYITYIYFRTFGTKPKSYKFTFSQWKSNIFTSSQ